MYFTSLNFCLFLFCLFIGYYIIFRRWQWQFLLAASLIFYSFFGWNNLIFICVTICSTWFAGRQMKRLRIKQEQYFSGAPSLTKEEKKGYRKYINSKLKKWLIICLLFNFSMLAVLKYSNFIISNVSSIISIAGGQPFAPINLLLPAGISFYTFQSMGYIIDVYRGSENEPNIFKFALFVSFFPQIIQGPISRFVHLNKTLFIRHKFDFGEFQAGFARILWGFFKKLVIADRLFAAVTAISSSPDEYKGVYVILTMFIYIVTLYADFTGGIDITIGTARMLGINIQENFNRPFYAVSMADYWRRWHISMGAWFKDYLFYPLSTSKTMINFSKKIKKTFGEGFGQRIQFYTTMIILWCTTGLWHGAQWYLVVWGLLNGMVLIISEELRPVYIKFHKRFPYGQTLWYRAFQVCRTFCLMSFLATFHVYTNARLTFRMYFSIIADFDWGRFITQGLDGLGLNFSDYTAIISAILIMVIVGFFWYNKKVEFKNLRPVHRNILIAALFFIIVIFGVHGFGYDSQQFIYNQF
jgi:D-alanyl-lipoteichoic acid acyltransferase DltB (MBOAT superfamily)